MLRPPPSPSHQLTEQDKAMGEEERFSGVLGTGGMTHQLQHQGHRGSPSGNGSSSNNNNNSTSARFASPRSAPVFVPPSSGGGHMRAGGAGGGMGGSFGSANSGSSAGSISGGGISRSPSGPGVYVPPALRAGGGGGDSSPTMVQVWCSVVRAAGWVHRVLPKRLFPFFGRGGGGFSLQDSRVWPIETIRQEQIRGGFI